MSDNKKEGGLMGMLGGLIFEDEPGTGPPPSAVPATASMPAPQPAAYVPSNPTPSQSLASEVDPDALKAVNEKVYSVGTHIVSFIRMQEALGNPGADKVIKALQVTQPDLTTTILVQDIDTHLQLLAEGERDTAAAFAAEEQKRLGERDQQIQQLKQANESAAAEIARHEKETTERNAKIRTLETERADEAAKIDRGKSRYTTASEVVRTQLTSLRQSFGATS